MEDAVLLRRLRDSRRRFQRRMQQLIEKYNQPFEDGPLVQMSTLTYQTPQGLKIWGGKLIKEGGEGLIQDPPWKLEERIEGPGCAETQGDEPLLLCTIVGAGSRSSDAGVALEPGSPVAQALVPSVPWSPLKNELRRKYLTQVDALLQDAGCFEDADKREKTDTPMTPEPSLASPATPGPGCCGSVSAESPGDPVKPTPSPREPDSLCPCPADLATASRNNSVSLLGTSGCVSGQSFEADDICNVTISDLYSGMLHSMSRLLSTKPSSIISTKTFVQSWSSRRRPVRRGRPRGSELHCARAWRSRRASRERPAPCLEPRQKITPLRDCKNLLHVTQHKPALKLDSAFLAGNKAQVLKLDPCWKELHVTPQKYSSLTSLDLNTVCSSDQENRLRMLKWLISPIKIVSRPRMLPSQAENRYREIEMEFNKLHQECCPSLGKRAHPGSFSGSWAMDVYRGGSVSPGGLRRLETHRWSLPLSKSEAFENLGKRSVEVGGGVPESDPSPSRPKGSPSQGPGCSWQTSGLSWGHDSGIFRKALSPSHSISVPRIAPLACERNHFNEIKEKFDQLHQECCQTPPSQRAKAPAHLGVSPDEASVGVQHQAQELFRKSNRDSLLQKLSLSSPWHMRSPQGSPTAEAHPSARAAHATRRDPQFPTKRRRLSYPQVCGHGASFQETSEVNEAGPRPGEQGGPPQASW